MAKYLLVFNGGDMPEWEAAQKAVMDAWTGWFTKLGDALVDPGNPTTPNAKTIHSDGKVTNGPVGTMASGYSIYQGQFTRRSGGAGQGLPGIGGRRTDFRL